MTNLIIALGWIALVTLVLAPIVYCVYTFAPKVVDFVKSFIKWHFHD